MRLPNGFTLIELLVVISIIVVLSTVGILVYETSLNSGNDTKRISDILQIQKALESYYTANNSYPSNLSSVSTYFQAGVAPCDPGTVPCTTGGSGYNYTACSSNTTYILCATPATCGNKCTATASTCGTTISTPGTAGTTLYCVKSVSN